MDFIELTNYRTKEKINIKTDQIVAICEAPNYTYIVLNSGNDFYVSESYGAIIGTLYANK